MKAARAMMVVLGLLTFAAADEAPRTRATMASWYEYADQREGHDGWTRRRRTATFELGPATYAVQYSGSRPPAGGPDDPGEGPIGLPRPTSEGWYHGGFLHISANGRNLDPVPLSSFELVETGQRAMAQMVFRDDACALRVRFIGLPGDDKLLVEVTAEPTEPLRDLTLRLVAYPSYFTSHNKRVGARRTLTPAGVVAQDETRDLTPDEAWWAVLYDEVFDPARGEGRGACAMATDPASLASVRVEPRSYPSTVVLKAKPGVKTVRLAVWEFPDQPNAAAIARFPKAADEALAALRGLHTTPAMLKGYDPAEALAELAAARADEALLKQFGPQLEAYATWLDSAKAAASSGGALSIVDEERFLLGYREQTEMLWQLRLARLLKAL